MCVFSLKRSLSVVFLHTKYPNCFLKLFLALELHRLVEWPSIFFPSPQRWLKFLKLALKDSEFCPAPPTPPFSAPLLPTLEQITNWLVVLDPYHYANGLAHTRVWLWPKTFTLGLPKIVRKDISAVTSLKPKNIPSPWMKKRRLKILGSLVNGIKQSPPREA